MPNRHSPARPRMWFFLLLPAVAMVFWILLVVSSSSDGQDDNAFIKKSPHLDSLASRLSKRPSMSADRTSVDDVVKAQEESKKAAVDYLCLAAARVAWKSSSVEWPDRSHGATSASTTRTRSSGFFFDVVQVDGPHASESSFRVVVWSPRHSSSKNACDAYLADASDLLISRDRQVVRDYRRFFHSEWFEATALPSGKKVAGSILPSSSSSLLRPTLFLFDNRTCTYYSQAISLSPPEGDDHLLLMVDHLHEQFRQVREIEEEAHYDYRPMVRLGHQALPTFLGEAITGSSNVNRPHVSEHAKGADGVYRIESRRGLPNRAGEASLTRCALRQGGWRSVEADEESYHSSPRYGGYWLAYKGMPHAAHYASRPNFQYDYLGRMNYGVRYEFTQPTWGAVAHVAMCRVVSKGNKDRLRDCVLEAFRNRRVYFFGDSHMRIFFYGFLSLVGVSYPADKVWRGDRRDVIDTHNVTVMYIASYFLNMSRPSALEMLADGGDGVVIVAGVGQHHSCHCWPVAKHMEVVRDALDALLAGAAAKQRTVVWFGIPAQPYNTHLYRKKPVGQSRKDCRNNARHYLYSLAQLRELHVRWSGLGGEFGLRPTLLHVDAFKYSLGMQHTSLDGAHYYGWVRDAWLDDLVAQVASSGLR